MKVNQSLFTPARISPLCKKCIQVELDETFPRATSTECLGDEIHLKWGLYGTPLCILNQERWLNE